MRPSRRDCRLFALAAAMAVGGENKTRVGAVLSKGRTILSRACNTARNEVANVQHGHATYHAERVVLRGHEHRFNCTLYVARLGLNGELRPSRPCRECDNHILYGTAVSRLVYLNDNNELVKVKR